MNGGDLTQLETGREIGLTWQRTMPWNPMEVSMHFVIWGTDPNSSISVWSLIYLFIFTKTEARKSNILLISSL